MNRSKILIHSAGLFVGLVEASENKGPMVDLFQRLTGTPGQAWCASFVEYLIRKVDESFPTQKTWFPVSASCSHLWKSAPPDLVFTSPFPGAVVFWRHTDKDGNDTGLGHTGIVSRVIDTETFETIEGNTSDSEGINREGDGVFRKLRKLNPSGTMLLNGFVWPWSDPDEEL